MTESFVAVVQDSYLDSLNNIMSKYSIISDSRLGYMDNSNDVFQLDSFDSYNAGCLGTLYSSVFQYYVDKVNPNSSEIGNDNFPCLCIRHRDLSYALEKNSSFVMCVKLDDEAVGLIDGNRIINMSDVQSYYGSQSSVTNKQFRKNKDN